MTVQERVYIKPAPSPFSTDFRKLYDAIWDAEATFDLLFREDQKVFVWAANRVRFYYELAQKMGIYTTQSEANTAKAPDPPPLAMTSLPKVDVYVQSGALGPAAANRARPYGCVYTERYVKALLDRNCKVLLLHDAPDQVAPHPDLTIFTSRQLSLFSAQTKQHFPSPQDCYLSDQGAKYWANVDAFLHDRLGVHLLDRERINKLILSHRRAAATQTQLFRQCRPNGFLIMAHYFRAPQIEAAHAAGVRVADFQHGINSRYHLGYGFPHIHADHRKIPYYPNEFWSWGRFWTDPEWFPTACCDPRPMGHHQWAGRLADSVTPRNGKTLLLATSWAMQNSFLEAANNLALSLPNWRIIIKLHPREVTETYAHLAERHANVTVLAGTVDIIEASRDADIVVSICSSSLFDVLLNGCRVMVIDAPSVEYTEDFVKRYDVPVLKLDCSNIAACIAATATQNIPAEEVFANPTTIESDLAFEGLASTATKVRADTGPRPPPRQLPPQKPARMLSWFQPTPSVAKKWDLKSARAAFVEARDRGDANKQTELIPELIAHGAPSTGYRSIFLRALWDVANKKGVPTAQRRMNDYISRIPGPELASNLPILEHALRVGAAAPFLGRFNVRLGDRKWRTAAALLAGTNRVAKRISDVLIDFAEASSDEFFDIRVSAGDQTRLFKNLEARIMTGEPFAMIRLGDGEVYGCRQTSVSEATRDADSVRREIIWWGCEQSPALRERLRREFQASLDAADYLGIPSSFRLLRDLPPFLDEFRRPIDTWNHTVRAHYVLLMELKEMHERGELRLGDKILVDDRCHQPLFTPKRTVDLLARCDHVVSISCFDKTRLNAALGTDLIRDHVLLPPHMKVKDNVAESAIKEIPTPQILDDIYAQIDDVVRKGSAVLVAGGFVGKMLIARAKANGGMVLDIGASADYWVGLNTRGLFDFVDYADAVQAPKAG